MLPSWASVNVLNFCIVIWYITIKNIQNHKTFMNHPGNNTLRIKHVIYNLIGWGWYSSDNSTPTVSPFVSLCLWYFSQRVSWQMAKSTKIVYTNTILNNSVFVSRSFKRMYLLQFVNADNVYENLNPCWKDVSCKETVFKISCCCFLYIYTLVPSNCCKCYIILIAMWYGCIATSVILFIYCIYKIYM